MKPIFRTLLFPHLPLPWPAELPPLLLRIIQTIQTTRST